MTVVIRSVRVWKLCKAKMLSVKARSIIPMRHSPFGGEMVLSNVSKHYLVLLHLRRMFVMSHSLAPHARHLLRGGVKMKAPARKVPKRLHFAKSNCNL